MSFPVYEPGYCSQNDAVSQPISVKVTVQCTVSQIIQGPLMQHFFL